MTEFSTNNDNKSHLSQPLQNSPRHFIHNPYQATTSTTLTSLHPNSPQHLKHLNAFVTIKENHHHQQQQHNQKLNQQTLPVNSSATTTPNSSAKHSPLHYRKPFNSPNYSPFACGYNNTGFEQQSNKNATATTAQQQQQYLRQHGNKLPYLTQNQYQQHLNDLLLQQQHLQQQQQQLLSDKEADEELSEESLKQNVAIVLNNLDRYNTALRSIILNEQVSSNSSVFLDDDSLLFGNNNFLHDDCGKMATAITPESDYNSNATTPGSRSNMLPLDSNMLQQQQQQNAQQQQQQHLVGYATAGAAAAAGGGNSYNNLVGGGCGVGINVGGGFCSFGNNVAGSNLNCSLASSHDFTHDNSDYQWFLDYGYRDGSAGMQRSVLSSLSASGLGDLIYYEDLAKNLDANLAEVDMESFSAGDIHSLLSHLPSYCKSLGNGSNRLQQSLMLQQHLLPALSQNQQQAQQMSQTSTTSTNDMIDNSICKSELLFSPVKESHISVDSLDMDAYPDEGDIILTCNKDNYTIAFEGSVLYSDESYYAEPTDIALKNKQNCINLHSNLNDIVKGKSMEMSMSRSEQAVSARARLQKSNTTQLQRYPSGNNNTSDAVPPTIRQVSSYTVRKSSSLPNLRENDDLENSYQQEQLLSQEQQHQQQQHAVSTSTLQSCKLQHLLPMCQMPISCNSNSESTMEQLTTQNRQRQCCCGNNVCANSIASNNSHNAKEQQQHQQQQKHSITGSASSGNSNPPSFNLVKIFIKQKSNNCCTEQQQQASSHTCMDVSSGCWPSSDAAGSSSSSSLEQRMRKKSLNDSGKGSALSRHDEEENAIEELAQSTPKKHLRMRHDAAAYEDVHSSSSTTGSLTLATNSPAHKRRSMSVRNPQISQLVMQHKNNNGNSLQSSDGSRSNSEPLTQLYLSNDTASTERRKSSCRAVCTTSSNDMITRSMQTSCGSLSTRSSVSDRFRCVPASFLSKLNNLGDQNQAPIYVIYPNYALPDLGFVKTQTTADVIFSPFNYKAAINGAASSSTASLKKRFSLSGDNEDEILKAMNYKHVQDWQSLATLLPIEYRRRLKHIPEMSNIVQQLETELSQKPLFCMTPPVRRNRTHICDCTQLMHQATMAAAHSAGDGSSSSGSSQQPSSGYRGSSTLLTDSELDNVDPLKQMYVYQYEQQKLDAGVELAKKPPQPMPRGILRKTHSQSARTKRNSMIEEEQHTKLSKLEKRRSLQEPPHHYGLSSAEELSEVFEEETHEDMYATPLPRKERLSRKDLDARARAENFLSSLPRNELKYYAEIAAILESSETHVQYDAAALKKEVSRALSQQKKVSFTDMEEQQTNRPEPTQRQQRFSTPPNSPNISMAIAGAAAAAAGLRTSNAANIVPRTGLAHLPLDEKDKRKIESNPFKRLQIQWELMSKDSTMLKDLANTQHTKSGGSTPTSAQAHNPKSRIPRPVSYPAGNKTAKSKSDSNLAKKSNTKTNISPQISRITTQSANGGKTRRSPSRIVPPKRYSITTTSPVTPTGLNTKSPTTTGSSGNTIGVGTRARTPNNRTTSAGVVTTAPSTPKRKVQAMPRILPRAVR